ncbi:MAG: AAA family ATPase [Xanthomonadales bacterium]|nr:AAA family ATPase [Xanthomonadales bacterium]
MYLKHYGLAESPFSITPDPRFVFLSDRHRDALAHLVYGISQGGGGGFVQLTGEVGTGKTTLSRLLLAQLPDNTQVALILNPRLEPIELLEALCEELGIDIDAGPRPARGRGKALVDALNRFLLQAHADGRRVVLMLDEAQELPVASLEQVRLLTNLETASQKLLQIVLLGQPELRTVLARPDLRQLAQRITARYHLTPLSSEETAAYVRHRLAVAGLARSPFEPGALAALHRHSGGVPRLINVIAERALLIGYGADLERLPAAVVTRAANEVLAQATLARSAGAARMRWPVAVAALALLAVIALAALAPWWSAPAPEGDPGGVAGTDRVLDAELVTAAAVDGTVPAAAAGPAPGTGLAIQSPAPALARLWRTPVADAHAADALLDLWQADPALDAHDLADCPFRLGGGLYCLRSRGTLGQLAALDRPVLLLIPVGERIRPLALAGLDRDQARVIGDGAPVSLPRALLENAWPGEYLALMQLPGAVATIGHPPLPAWTGEALARFEANRSLPPLSNGPDRIRRLQQHHGLSADGVVGPETWWALAAYLDSGPRLAPPAQPAQAPAGPEPEAAASSR